MRPSGVANLRDVEAIEQEAPLEARLRHRSVWEAFQQVARRHANSTAVSLLRDGRADGPVQTLTYAELHGRAIALANWMRRASIESASVALLLPNIPEFYCCYLGSQALGVPCPINPGLSVTHISAILRGADARVLVVEGPTRDPVAWRAACESAADTPSLRNVLAIGGGASGMPRHVTVTSFEEIGSTQDHEGPELGSHVTHASPAAFFHTGGTTGAPKLAIHTHGNQLYEAWAIAHLVEFNSADVVLIGLPLFHVHAVIPLSLAPLLQGAHLVLLSAQGFRNPEVIRDFWRIVARFRATAFSGVPTVYAALLGNDSGSVDVSTLRFAICGSAPLPTQLVRDFEQRTGLAILEGYGLTEGTCVSSLNPIRGPRRTGSIGLRLPYQDMKVAKLDDTGKWQRDCALGETGEILISGPNIFAGYADREQTAQVFAALGWLATGDLGHVDADGFFWISGRSKDLIKRSGHSIDPKAVEEALHTHGAIATAAVVGRRDARAGEVPVAFVALKPGRVEGKETLLAECRQIVGDPISAPVDLHILDTLPLTAVGKIDKVKLREMTTQNMEEHKQ